MPDPTDWTTMSKENKHELFSNVLTKAATDRDFRERCLASDLSAVAAITEFFNVVFPRDFTITFVNARDCRENTNRMIIKLPDYQGEGVQNFRKEAGQDDTPCTYSQWVSDNA